MHSSARQMQVFLISLVVSSLLEFNPTAVDAQLSVGTAQRRPRDILVPPASEGNPLNPPGPHLRLSFWGGRPQVGPEAPYIT